MDGNRFDSLARTVGRRRSRRGAFQALAPQRLSAAAAIRIGLGAEPDRSGSSHGGAALRLHCSWRKMQRQGLQLLLRPLQGEGRKEGQARQAR